MGILKAPRRQTWRLALANTAVGVAVFVILAVSPAPVTFPSSQREALLLATGAIVLLVANGVVAAVGAASAVQQSRAAERESPHTQRLRGLEHFAVVGDDGVVGVVAEVLADRGGDPAALVVESGWLRSTRFLVRLDEVEAVNASDREITLAPRPQTR